MPTYLVKLTPIDKFFFGQKNTFGDDNVNYFVRSSHFPQQTALLGLLRYQLLCHADKSVFDNNKIVNSKAAKELIGEKSFSPEEPSVDNFGLIESLSPVFLMDKETGELYLPAGLRYQEKEEGEYEPLHLKIEGGVALLEGYEAKKGVYSRWILGRTQSDIIAEDDFFKEDTRVGIRKNYIGGTEDDAFFCETFYHFNNYVVEDPKEGNETHSNCEKKLKKVHDYCFAFRFRAKKEIEFRTEAEKSVQAKESSVVGELIVHLGGERQPFLMEVTKEENADLLPLKDFSFAKDRSLYMVLLLSDACIPSEIAKKALFAITEVKDFACLLTQTDGDRRFYNRFGKRVKEHKEVETKDVHLTHERELYAAGSLFYFEDYEAADKFCQRVTSSHFHTIGYNYTTIIEPETNKKQDSI